jgi:uncharacterized protein YodC (DUF2158 family)
MPKLGDTVKLKSGGPVMTIRSFDQRTNWFTCHWFVGRELKTGEFSSSELVDSKPEDEATASPPPSS